MHTGPQGIEHPARVSVWGLGLRAYDFATQEFAVTPASVHTRKVTASGVIGGSLLPGGCSYRCKSSQQTTELKPPYGFPNPCRAGSSSSSNAPAAAAGFNWFTVIATQTETERWEEICLEAMAYFDSETEQPPEVVKKFKAAIEAAKKDDNSQ